MGCKTGQCLCGAVSFELTKGPDHYHNCYCKMCQRWSGSAFSSFSSHSSQINVAGEENIATYESSPWAQRAFCKKCGSNLWYKVTAENHEGDNIYVPIGLLDETDDVSLQSEIFVDYKTKAYDIPESIEKLTEAQVLAQFASPEDT